MAATGAALLTASVLGACSGTATGFARVVELKAHHSRFDPASVEVRRGTTVRFVVHNEDPIAHELIVGDEATHDRHEKGTEAAHGERAGGVTVPAATTRSTTFRFDRPGRVLFGCHLPGHWAYGMQGVVVVT